LFGNASGGNRNALIAVQVFVSGDNLETSFATRNLKALYCLL